MFTGETVGIQCEGAYPEKPLLKPTNVSIHKGLFDFLTGDQYIGCRFAGYVGGVVHCLAIIEDSDKLGELLSKNRKIDTEKLDEIAGSRELLKCIHKETL